jgi:hypothetical protein
MLPWKPSIWWVSAPIPALSSPSRACVAAILPSSVPELEPTATEPAATVAASASATVAAASAERWRLAGMKQPN